MGKKDVSGKADKNGRKKNASRELADEVAEALRNADTAKSRHAVRLWWTVVQAVAGLILSAYGTSQQMKQQGQILDAINELKNGLNQLDADVRELSSKIDALAETIIEIAEELRTAITEEGYKRVLQIQLGAVATSQQNLATYFQTDTIAWQRMDLIETAILEIQRATNTILNNPYGAKLDDHLTIAPWVALWRQSWDCKEQVRLANDPAYSVIDSSEHAFFKDYVASLKLIFEKCAELETEYTLWLTSTVFPTEGRTYKFDPKTGKFEDRGLFYPSQCLGPGCSNLIAQDSYYISMPFRALMSTMWPGDFKNWGPAAVRVGKTYQPNPKVADPDVAARACVTLENDRAKAVVYQSTLAQIQGAGDLLVTMTDALKTN